MKIATHECYVVTSWETWSGTSLHSDCIYTSEKEAKKVLTDVQKQNEQLSRKGFVLEVQSLSDYLQELRDEAYAKGEQNQIENR